MSKELEGLNLVPELRRLSIFHLPALSAHQNGEKKCGRGREHVLYESKFKVPNL